MRPATRRTPLLLALVAVLLALAACSTAGDNGDGGDSDSAGAGEFEEAAEAPAEEDSLKRSARDGMELADTDSFDYSSALNQQAPPDPDDAAKKIIAKGNVSLESDDVEAAVVDVLEVSDRYFGEVTERETTTNDDGDVNTARLLLRIPVNDFTNALTELEQVADLQSSNSGQEDVTTEVIDTEVRIRAQRRSLARVEALLDRAQSISDIIRIESQLSRRQADLESLEGRLSYLNNQTSMSTISVNISLPPKEKKEAKKEEPEEAGFLAGLEDGWQALKSFGTGTATVAGALLPWTVVLLVVGGPVLLLVRRIRRRDGDAPDVATPADA